MKKDFKKEIILLLKNEKDMTSGKLFDRMKLGKKEIHKAKAALNDLAQARVLRFSKGSYSLADKKSLFEGTITRVMPTFGFVRDEKSGEEYFVRGRALRGTVTGDAVLAKRVDDRMGQSDDLAEVVLLLNPTEAVQTGVIVQADNGKLKLIPSSFQSREPLTIRRYNGNELKAGDRVSFAIAERAENQSDHLIDVISVYGNAENAKIATEAYLDEKGVRLDFPLEVVDEARMVEAKGISEKETEIRLDLRALPIFTVDGADTKDIDDAISLQKDGNVYLLGVHIADVSYYVKKGSALDKEAFARGTSIYIADKVVPMLPRELSNGICSLNPAEDRLAFSCLMRLSESGAIVGYEFRKTVIRSRVKGVYSEVNAILGDTADDAIREKYKAVISEIPLMNELAAILKSNREKRGAPGLNSPETKIICDENGLCTDVKMRTSGISEGIIEEFMLAANNCAAKLAMSLEIPFVYRVHEPPTEEKLTNLGAALEALAIPEAVTERTTAPELAALLLRVNETDKSDIINRLVLRTMMKAQYSELPLGHYGLQMKEYAHFTSPIRRLADLSIHRILSDYVWGEKEAKLQKRYAKFAVKAALQASQSELLAVSAERDCDKYYMAEYMKNHIGESFEGTISGVMPTGFFVMLPNTVEGRVGVRDLPAGDYDTDNNLALVEAVSGKRYTIGDKVNITCTAASVSMGTVDFALAKGE